MFIDRAWFCRYTAADYRDRLYKEIARKKKEAKGPSAAGSTTTNGNTGEAAEEQAT